MGRDERDYPHGATGTSRNAWKGSRAGPLRQNWMLRSGDSIDSHHIFQPYLGEPLSSQRRSRFRLARLSRRLIRSKHSLPERGREGYLLGRTRHTCRSQFLRSRAASITATSWLSPATTACALYHRWKPWVLVLVILCSAGQLVGPSPFRVAGPLHWAGIHTAVPGVGGRGALLLGRLSTSPCARSRDPPAEEHTVCSSGSGDRGRRGDCGRRVVEEAGDLAGRPVA